MMTRGMSLTVYEPLFAIRNSSGGKADEIMAPVKINNIPCNLELDTGVSHIL